MSETNPNPSPKPRRSDLWPHVCTCTCIWNRDTQRCDHSAPVYVFLRMVIISRKIFHFSQQERVMKLQQPQSKTHSSPACKAQDNTPNKHYSPTNNHLPTILRRPNSTTCTSTPEKRLEGSSPQAYSQINLTSHNQHRKLPSPYNNTPKP